MSSKLVFGLAKVIAILAFLSIGYELDRNLQKYDSLGYQLQVLEQEYGECGRSLGMYGTLECPTSAMKEMTIELNMAEGDIDDILSTIGLWGEDPETVKGLSYTLALVSPFIILLIQAIFNNNILPLYRRSVQAGKAGARKAGEYSSSTSKKAFTAAAQMSDTAKGRTMECPSCAELIKPSAQVCIHCGRDVV